MELYTIALYNVDIVIRLMTKLTKWHVRPAKTQISLAIHQSDQNLRCPHEESFGP